MSPDSSGGHSTMNSPKYSLAEIRAVWEEEGKALGWSNARPGPRPANDRPSCDAGETAAAKPDFRIWRDQNKVRGRLIGLGNGVVVARLNKDGLPE